MNTDMRHPGTARLFVGLGITAFGVVLLLERLGISHAAERLLRLWPAALIVFGAVLVLQALRGVPMRIGPGYGRRHGSFLRLVIWGLVLSAIFSRFVSSHSYDVVHADTPAHTQLLSLMNGDQRASITDSFRRADMTAVMGGTSLDLRHAVMVPGQEATVEVFALMGGAVVRVPDDWQVDVQITPVMGAVKNERGRPRSAAAGAGFDDGDAPVAGAAPRLIIKGIVVMGGLVVKS
jgi:hypothetical protein